MLELAILGLLKEQDLHGYELKKRLADTLGVVSGVSFGSLYPALARLERAGAVHTVEVAVSDPPELGADGMPRSRPARPRGARSRKVYGITSQGEELFGVLLAADTTSIEDSRVFHLRLAFARYLSPDARIGMLERRRAHLIDRLSRAGTKGRAGRRVDGYVRSLIEHDREATEHDLSWIERLIARERDLPSDGAATPTSSSAAPSAAAFQSPAPLVSAAPSLSGLWRARGSDISGRAVPGNQISGPAVPGNQISGPAVPGNQISGPAVPSNQKESTS